MRLPRVEVDWLDSCAMERWTDPATVKRASAARCKTVGYLVRDDEDVLVIASSYSLNETGDQVEEYGSALAIPRVALLGQPKELRR